MHLAIVSPFPPAITGIGQYGYHITRALEKSGLFARVTVLAGSKSNGKPPNHLGTTEIEYCWAPGHFNARQAIVSRVKELNPDLVWLNLGASIFGKSPWLNLSGLLAPKLIHRLGYPTVITLHELIELTNLRALNAPGGPLASWGARFLTEIATQGDIVCLTMRHYVDWLSSRRPEACYLHIPHGAFDPPEILPESEIPELLFFSTLAPYKRLEILLEAFGILKADYPALKLTVAGAEHIRYPNYVHQLKIEFKDLEGIQWLGEVQEDDLRGLFQRAQVVILPYQASTGSSSVLVRAATWGRSVITSDLPEIQTFVREMGLDVTYFQQGKVSSLVNVLKTHLNSRENRSSQAQHNLVAIQRNRLEVICQDYIHAFNLALKASRSPKRITLLTQSQSELT